MRRPTVIRDRQPELMDNPALDHDEHRAALRSLDRVNNALGVNRRLFRAIRTTACGPVDSILDVGTGGGGFLRYCRGQRPSDKPSLLIGLDRSASALAMARSWSESNDAGDLRPNRPATSPHTSIRSLSWISADARRLPLQDASVDVVVCSLFLHHFDEAEIVDILREFARVARRGVVVGDLVRSRASFVLTWLATRLTSRSRVFHVDGPRSVRAALTPTELRSCADRAGMHGAIVRGHLPFRMILSWTRAGR